MRCKQCGFVKKNNLKWRCWQEFQLCGECCVELHPELYPYNMKNKKTYIGAKNHEG